MKGMLLNQFGEMGTIIFIGVVIIVLFIVLRFFKMILSGAFIGFLLSLFSYFVYEFIVFKIPLIAAFAFILCVTGFGDRGLIGKFFALVGTILSAYIILGSFGIIPIA